MNIKRIDVLLVEREFAKSRAQAQVYIKNGQVYIDNKNIDKSSIQVDESADIKIHGELQKYVSRGGYKLEDALNKFKIDLKGKVCMDVGASTGGFTDCMLQNGASKVYAIDVGHSQLDSKLIEDIRVVSMEKTNIKDVEKESFDPIDFICIDVSFTSLTNIMDHIKDMIGHSGEMVALIKPQFEVGRGNLNKKGIVKDEKVRKKTVDKIIEYMVKSNMFVKDIIESPIKGNDGNIEYLMYIKKEGEDIGR
ncbi:MAG TPA: TlyA family rRNA (cytidine-2'-O)-methyltransferase [Clostridiales bacterium]|nr:TlyA family rRNA (cytidine-2'-O)-methyltransferase [Clostridiales bacterium]